MKLLFFALICFMYGNSWSQSVILKGKIKCLNQYANSSKGAENIVVVPLFKPSVATITIAQPSGFFEFNTGLPMSTLQDKTVSIYAVSRCVICKEVGKRIFISEDQDRQNRDDTKRYVTIKNWTLNTTCQSAELMPVAADSILSVVVRQPDQDLDHVTASTALIGTPPLLNFLSTLTTVVNATGFPSGSFKISSLDTGLIKYGESFFASSLIHSATVGFNFAPSRDKSEAVFWNPSALSFTKSVGSVNLFSNYKNNIKAAGYYKINKKWSIGLGFIQTRQVEFRKATYIDQFENPRIVDTNKMRNKERRASLSMSFMVNDEVSVGGSIKSTGQLFNIPDSLFIEAIGNDGFGSFYYKQIHTEVLDIDLSASFKLGKSIQIGLNFMNVMGSTLYKDAFKEGQREVPLQYQRSLGLGLTYKLQRINLGVDLLLTSNGLYDAGFGVNLVPFNHAIISVGGTARHHTYSLGFRLKHFRLTYIEDQSFLVNENTKIKYLKGKLYGGFSFEF